MAASYLTVSAAFASLAWVLLGASGISIARQRARTATLQLMLCGVLMLLAALYFAFRGGQLWSVE